MKLTEALEKVTAAIEAAQALDRSREASIVITNLETAKLWLKEIKE